MEQLPLASNRRSSVWSRRVLQREINPVFCSALVLGLLEPASPACAGSRPEGSGIDCSRQPSRLVRGYDSPSDTAQVRITLGRSSHPGAPRQLDAAHGRLQRWAFLWLPLPPLPPPFPHQAPRAHTLNQSPSLTFRSDSGEPNLNTAGHQGLP